MANELPTITSYIFPELVEFSIFFCLYLLYNSRYLFLFTLNNKDNRNDLVTVEGLHGVGTYFCNSSSPVNCAIISDFVKILDFEK